MENCVVVGDTHLGLSKNSDSWCNITLRLFEEIHDTCVKRNIKNVIHVGDFFHERRSLNTLTQVYAFKIADLFDMSNINLYAIVGNHDCYYKNIIKPTSLQIFKKYPTIKIIDEIYPLTDDILLVPWNTPIPTKYNQQYVFGHFEIKGFQMNNRKECDKGVDPDIFKPYRRIFSGHFHMPSTKGNITYLGSPFQQTFNDVGNICGYYIFKEGELEFIQFRDCPSFIVIDTDVFFDKGVDRSDITGNIVKIKYKEDYGTTNNMKILDEIQMLLPFQLYTDFSQTKIEGVEGESEELDAPPSIIDHDDIIDEYIKKTEVPENINKKTLVGMIMKLKEEIEGGK